MMVHLCLLLITIFYNVNAHGWSDWVCANPNGAAKASISASGVIHEIIAQEQPGYGIVNFGIVPQYPGSEAWTTNNFRGYRRILTLDSPIYGISVREQGGYGIVNMRAVLGNGRYSNWITSNTNGVVKEIKYFPSIKWIQGREQGGYGIVDLRVWDE
mmetsp:Transcript_18764/g.16708  ORF Transcript_18764/g.16708 Transcript_18764/m.16708 type:complete len:157 (-) Transcript_18764:53-523(-)|eukprot:CAMPEP_0201581216 /NCGR_PEP_ID=MMETSP0190_2-20130828/64561_1 /ASSEMBLY_ACC=CAM_ASM_000263 /TAXON_ID=37353 /ORGANISM="Rosalina sp." /LENGTH=156 /DNA_ID=CAMNT_0048018703 /DNA_START=75 /DNA_END=545 /DNA_ORIENTATION=+